MNKRGMSYITVFIILIALTVGVGVTSNPNFDLDEFKSSLTWNNIDLEGDSDLIQALEYFINGLGAASFSFAKWIAELAAENPTVPFKLLMVLFLFAIIAPVLLVLFKFTVIIVILINEYRHKRREKHGRK